MDGLVENSRSTVRTTLVSIGTFISASFEFSEVLLDAEVGRDGYRLSYSRLLLPPGSRGKDTCSSMWMARIYKDVIK